MNRANRRVEEHHLAIAARGDEDTVLRVEERLLGRTRQTWRKTPDRPLGEHRARQRKRRAQSYRSHRFMQYVNGTRPVPADLDPNQADWVFTFQYWSAEAEVIQDRATQEKARAARQKEFDRQDARRKLAERRAAHRKAAVQQRKGLAEGGF
ncbi:hypothetical protein [Kineosporia babensis]|uniref:Uncharacterized protein n=1 Tax=Kineosporia babensis TaxID=499548 RepID=A0A9X1SUT9_9ACTN|nr:hypothetical protein [Kineosporia babensis]MCD5312085.1 hypothetical protein [Kineosporia babensis]